MVMKESIVDIIIPTYNNLTQLTQCIDSILCTSRTWPIRIIIVNNGNKECQITLSETEVDIDIVLPIEGNIGWTDGLIEGLKRSTSEYVMFANDDIYIPPSSYRWLRSMARLLINDRSLAAVGPSSNCAMGLQNIWATTPSLRANTTFLIGFCMLVKREYLDEVGGIDPDFNTGDDIDLSIRFRDNGYGLVVDKSTFVYHHGFQTGERIHGTPDKPGGWNSKEMINTTNEQLIKKHGFLKWWHTMVKPSESEVANSIDKYPDIEGDIVRDHINGDHPSKILEIGCGPKLTIPGSVGLDMVSNGYSNPHVSGNSVAEITHNLDSGDMPFNDESYKVVIARHIIEHCIDPISVLRDIYRVLTIDGKFIVALPDEKIGDTIYMNPEHLHAYTAGSFINIAEAVGFKAINTMEGYNGVSFTILFEKNGEG